MHSLSFAVTATVCKPMISFVAFMNDRCNGGQGIYAAFVYTRVPCSYYVEMVFLLTFCGGEQGKGMESK